MFSFSNTWSPVVGRVFFLLGEMYVCACYQSPGSECYISAISALPGSSPAKVTWPELQSTAPSQPGQMVPSAHITFWYHFEGEDITGDIHKPWSFTGRSSRLNTVWQNKMHLKKRFLVGFVSICLFYCMLDLHLWPRWGGFIHNVPDFVQWCQIQNPVIATKQNWYLYLLYFYSLEINMF